MMTTARGRTAKKNEGPLSLRWPCVSSFGSKSPETVACSRTFSLMTTAPSSST